MVPSQDYNAATLRSLTMSQHNCPGRTRPPAYSQEETNALGEPSPDSEEESGLELGTLYGHTCALAGQKGAASGTSTRLPRTLPGGLRASGARAALY